MGEEFVGLKVLQEGGTPDFYDIDDIIDDFQAAQRGV